MDDHPLLGGSKSNSINLEIDVQSDKEQTEQHFNGIEGVSFTEDINNTKMVDSPTNSNELALSVSDYNKRNTRRSNSMQKEGYLNLENTEESAP